MLLHLALRRLLLICPQPLEAAGASFAVAICDSGSGLLQSLPDESILDKLQSSAIVPDIGPLRTTLVFLCGFCVIRMLHWKLFIGLQTIQNRKFCGRGIYCSLELMSHSLGHEIAGLSAVAGELCAMFHPP